MNSVERLQLVRGQIADGCRAAGRSVDEVELLAVSKTFPAEAVREVANAGQMSFGENRVQEALEKIPQLPENLSWHLIGPLQRNKVRKVVGELECLQGIDSLKLAQAVDRVALELGIVQSILLQIKIGGEATKSGFDKDELLDVLPQLVELKGLKIDGAMTIPPPVSSKGEARSAFAEMREFVEVLRKESGLALSQLSMGMSSDFRAAILEGSTMVRVGSAIFGHRDVPAASHH